MYLKGVVAIAKPVGRGVLQQVIAMHAYAPAFLGLDDPTAQRLRQQLEAQLPAEVYYAPPQLCTDNGAMIAYAGALRLLAGSGDEHLAINTRARWPLDELPPISTP